MFLNDPLKVPNVYFFKRGQKMNKRDSKKSLFKRKFLTNKQTLFFTFNYSSKIGHIIFMYKEQWFSTFFLIGDTLKKMLFGDTFSSTKYQI